MQANEWTMSIIIVTVVLALFIVLLICVADLIRKYRVQEIDQAEIEAGRESYTARKTRVREERWANEEMERKKVQELLDD